MSSAYLWLFKKEKKVNKTKSILKIVPFVFKGKELAPCCPFLIFSNVFLLKVSFSFGIHVWPIVPNVSQAYSRCGVAMVRTWFSLKQKKKIIFDWMWWDHPSYLIRLVSNTEQEPCAWNVCMVWKRAFWKIILWLVQLDNCNVVYKRVEEFHSILFVVRSINCVNFFKRKIVELMNWNLNKT